MPGAQWRSFLKNPSDTLQKRPQFKAPGFKSALFPKNEIQYMTEYFMVA
jgi:hypothetical protein